MKRTTARLMLALVTLVALFVVTLNQPHTALAQDADCFVLGDDIVVETGEVRDCNVLVGKGDVIVREGGAVAGDIAVAGGDVEIAGQVTGDVWASGDIVLSSSADVTGDVVALGEVEPLPGAHVGGRIGRVQSVGEAIEDSVGDEAGGTTLSSEESAALSIGFVVVLVVLATLFAALATILAPTAVGNVRGALSVSPGRSLFLGLVALIAAPFLLLILVPVFPLIPVVAFAYLVVLTIGAVGLSEWFGRRLAPRARRPVQAAAGAALLALVLSVGYAVGSQISHGWLLSSLTMLLQFALASLAAGAAILTLLGTRTWPRQDDLTEGNLVPLPGEEPLDDLAAPAGTDDASDSATAADLDAEGSAIEDSRATDAADPDAAGAAAAAAAGPEATGAAGAAVALAAAAVAADADAEPDGEAAIGDSPTDETSPPGLVGAAAEGPDAPTAAMAAIPLATGVGESPGDETTAPEAKLAAGAAAVQATPDDESAADDGPKSDNEPTPDDEPMPDDEPTPGWGPTDPEEELAREIDPAPSVAEDVAGAATSSDTPPDAGADTGHVEPSPTGEADSEVRPAPKSMGLGEVHGISPIYQHLLMAGGVSDLSALAAADPQAIAEIASAPGVTPVDTDTAGRWVQQARELLS